MRFVLVGFKNSDLGLITITKVMSFNDYDQAKEWCKDNYLKDGVEWFVDGIEERQK